MVYLYIEIYSFKQLLKIGVPFLSKIDHGFNKLIEERGIEVLHNKNGLFLFCLGDEKQLETENILDSVLVFYSILNNGKKRLHGYNLFLSARPSTDGEVLLHDFQQVLFGIKEEEGLWIHKSNKSLFKTIDVIDEVGDYLSITFKKQSIQTEKYISQIQRIKKDNFDKLLKIFSRIKPAPGKCSVFLIHSRRRVLARSIAENVLKKYVGRKLFPYIPIINPGTDILYQLLPFVHSINSQFINKLKPWLNPPMKKVWEEKKQLLLDFLQGKYVMADHANRDIFYAYHLYLEAYCKMMQRKSLPAVLICDNIELSGGVFNNYLLSYLTDFSHRYNLLAIFISAKKKLPPAFGELKIKKIEIPPLSEKEVKTCFHILYPDITVPSGVIRQIHRLSEENYNAVLHYIYYLRRHNKIQETNNHYRWLPHAELSLQIPKQRLQASWQFIKSLKEEEKILLYVLMLTHTVVPYAQLVVFFESVGLKERACNAYLSYLKNTGLIVYTNENTPLFQGLFTLLKKNLGNQAEFYERKLYGFISQNLQSFLPFGAVPLIKLLYRLHNLTPLADILQRILQYCMDTLSLRPARFFLDLPAGLVKNKTQIPKREMVDLVCNTYYLRYLLLEGKAKEAQKLVSAKITQITFSYTADPIYADLHLQLSRYFLTQRETDNAVKEAKKAALAFQELSFTEKMSESYLELGQALLAKGSIFEALEYFEFTRKFSSETKSRVLQAKAYLLKSITLFFIGNYTQALHNLHSGIALSEAHGLRQFEHLLFFIKGRIQFDLGLYHDARVIFEQCLALVRAFSQKGCNTVLKAWIARTYGYVEEYEAAFRILDTLPENRETLFFRAELNLIQNKHNEAIKLIDKALGIKEKHDLFFSERFSWKNGFSMIEDRRFDLCRNGSALLRRLKAFKAYSGCFTGHLKEGLNELHTVTIREKLPAHEPYAHLYFFLYYLILTRCSVPKDPDSDIADSLTVLNLALKHLQERSTAIDQPRQRIHYLSKNYWNKLLFQQAKQNKLV